MKHLFFLAGVCILIGSAGHTAVAQDSAVVDGGTNTQTVASDPVTIRNPIQAETVTELFAALIDIILVFAIPIVVFFIIYAGFLYVTARGNESTIQKAHMALLYALIGGLLILGARVLIDVVKGTVEGVTGEGVGIVEAVTGEEIRNI